MSLSLWLSAMTAQDYHRGSFSNFSAWTPPSGSDWISLKWGPGIVFKSPRRFHVQSPMRTPDFRKRCSAGGVWDLNTVHRVTALPCPVWINSHLTDIQSGDRTFRLHEIALMRILSTLSSQSGFLNWICLMCHLFPRWLFSGSNVIHRREDAGTVNCTCVGHKPIAPRV